MDATLASQIFVWIVTGLVVVGGITLIGASWALGRQAYQKD